jgi:hypothetical protein
VPAKPWSWSLVAEQVRLVSGVPEAFLLVRCSDPALHPAHASHVQGSHSTATEDFFFNPFSIVNKQQHLYGGMMTAEVVLRLPCLALSSGQARMLSLLCCTAWRQPPTHPLFFFFLIYVCISIIFSEI